MTAAEALEFESLPRYREAVALRRWDDAAKLPNLRVPGLEPLQRYRVTDVTPGARLPRRVGLADARIADIEVSGAALTEIGLAIPAQRALTALVMLIEAI